MPQTPRPDQVEAASSQLRPPDENNDTECQLLRASAADQ